MDRTSSSNHRIRRGARLRWPACFAAAAFAAAALGFVQPESDVVPVQFTEPRPPAATVQRGSVSLQEAVAMALQRVPGTLVRADTITRGGRVEYHIRILTDGNRVRTVRIDAQSGQFL